MVKRLYRTEGAEAKLFGVCGGLADYLNLDPTIIRVALVLLVWLGGLSLWIYLLAALIIPRKSEVYPGF